MNTLGRNRESPPRKTIQTVISLVIDCIYRGAINTAIAGVATGDAGLTSVRVSSHE